LPASGKFRSGRIDHPFGSLLKRGRRNIRRDVAMFDRAINAERVGHCTVVSVAACIDDKGSMAQISCELAEICKEIATDEKTLVVVLTGATERAFSVAPDGIVTASRSEDESGAGNWPIAGLITRLNRPVIAAVNGDCMGRGLEAILACDLRIAADTCHFAFPHIRSGVLPMDGGTQRLPRLVGRAKALELILTGDVMNAEEAMSSGLINLAVPPDKLMIEVMGISQSLTRRDPVAVRHAGGVADEGMDKALENGLLQEADLYFLLQRTRERIKDCEAIPGG
jgi:enoyl-CoA hydratase